MAVPLTIPVAIQADRMLVPDVPGLPASLDADHTVLTAAEEIPVVVRAVAGGQATEVARPFMTPIAPRT